jgi:beta-galactosidase
VTPIPLDDIGAVTEKLRSVPAQDRMLAGPVFARAAFDLPRTSGDLPPDLFLSTAGWGKGIAWLNGFCLGRYWSRGPQRTLYVPGPVTRADGNELVILELHAALATASFMPGHDLGHTEP